MASYPLPVFYDLEQTLSTKKERKSMFSNYGRPPKAPVRSAPVRRIYSVYKDEAPKPVSFREGSDQSFITGSPLYSSKKGTYFEQCYEIESRLGEGDFGEVFKVISKENGKHYACKRNILKFRGERDRARRIQEVKNHEQLTPHVNIIKFYRAWEENNQLYLLTEVCKQSLADILYNTHEFPENQIWAYFIDILQGLDHLHLHKCIHMDVKPENIFIGLDGRCKLGDFGLVIDFSNGYPTEALDGDSKYLAPECLQRVYTPAADIFSLGIVLLEMATDLDLPKRGPLWHELRTGHIPSMDGRGLSMELRSTIKWLMEPDYRKRPTTTEVLNYKAVKRLSRKNNVIYFFRSKVQAFTSYISKFFILPFIFCSFIYVNLKKKLLNYEEKCSLTKDWTPNGLVGDNLNISNDESLNNSMMEYRRRFEVRPESVGNLSNSMTEDRRQIETLPQPVFNSTPVSSSKRKIFAYYDESLKLKGEDDEYNNDEDENADGSRYTFNESSFSSLELSRETSGAGISASESRLSTNITGKNLLQLFNTAGSSSEEDN